MQGEEISEIRCPVNNDVVRTYYKLPNGVELRYESDFVELAIIRRTHFGAIAKCQNLLDRKIYAVKKVLLERTITNWDDVQRDVTILSKMNHPNIVRYFQAWVEQKHYFGGYHFTPPLKVAESQCLYILMEHCPRSLASFMHDAYNHHDGEKAWKFFWELVSAVNHIHERNHIHRNLSPTNILLDSEDNIKVTDFKLATRLDDFVDSPMLTKYVDKMCDSPESSINNDIDAKTDIYSLGMILAELLYPFCSTDIRTTILTEVKDNNVFPSHWKREDVDYISILISIDPSNRPTAAQMLQGIPPPPPPTHTFPVPATTN